MTPPAVRRPTRVWTTREAVRAFSWSRFLLLLALVLAQGLTLLGVLWAGQATTERVVRDQTSTALRQLLQSASDNTSSYLTAATSMVRLSQSLLLEDLPDEQQQAQLLRSLSQVVDAVPQIDGAMVGRSNGSFTFVRRDGDERFVRLIRTRPTRQVTDTILSADGAVRQRDVVQDPYDPRTRPWFVTATGRPGHPVWTEPYVFASSKLPGITVSATLPGSSRRQNVVAMDVELRGLTRLLQSVPISPGGRAFITDGQGHALAASRAWPTTVQGRIPLLTEVADPPLQALLGSSGRLPSLSGSALTRQFSAEGQTYALSLRHFEVQPGMRWVIGVYAPESDFTSDLGRLYQQQRWTILAVMLLSSAVAWPLAFRATRPLAALHHQATTDALTGLQNRASFLAHLRESLAHSPEPGRELGVVIFDLDGFKAVNDTFGHARGDEVLSLIGTRLQAAVRSGDVLSRLGGDEFALIARGRTRESVRQRTEGLVRELQRPLSDSSGQLHPLGATAGLAFRDGAADTGADTGANAEALLARADRALILGKRQGKGRVWVSHESGAESGANGDPQAPA